MVRNPKKIPTKWLSKCESSLLNSKEKLYDNYNEEEQN